MNIKHCYNIIIHCQEYAEGYEVGQKTIISVQLLKV